MRPVYVALFFALLAGGAASSFGQQGQTEPGLADFMKAMTAVAANTNAAAGVVDFRELKALLPQGLEGMKRKSASGEKSGAMGMTIAYAEGEYENEAGGRIKIKISDNGGMGGLMAFAQAGWATQEIDKETDTGFERTTMYGEHKAKEQYDTQDKFGQIEIMIGGRFMVEASGNDVAFEAIQAAAKAVDFAKLGALKPKPAAP